MNLDVPEVGSTWYFTLTITAVPFIITVGCYIRTIMVFRKNQFGMKTKKNKALFLYPSVQILMLLAMTFKLLSLLIPSLSFGAKMLLLYNLDLLLQLGGFANAGIYFLQNRRKGVSSQPENKPLISSDNSENE